MKQDWNRPKNCHCLTLRQRSACYENCDPVPVKRPRKKINRYGLILVFGVILPLFLLSMLIALSATNARSADLDSYACFGAGRYAAMEQDLQCPKRATWRLPNYCDGLKLMERSCTSVKAVAKIYGRPGAERRARVCGATDEDIAEAAKCFQEKK